MKKLLTILLILVAATTYRKGDINRDGKVSITDLVIMRQMVEGIAKPSHFADLNYDGKVNEIDLNIMRYILSR